EGRNGREVLAQRDEARSQLLSRVAHARCGLAQLARGGAQRGGGVPELRLLERQLEAFRGAPELDEQGIEGTAIGSEHRDQLVDRCERRVESTERLLGPTLDARETVQDLDHGLLDTLQRRRRRGHVVPGRLERHLRRRGTPPGPELALYEPD